MNMNTPTEQDLQAFMDGQLDPEKSAWIEVWMHKNPEALAHIENLQQQDRQLRTAFQALELLPENPALNLAKMRADKQDRTRKRLALCAGFLLVFFMGNWSGWQTHSALMISAEPPMSDAMETYKLVSANNTAAKLLELNYAQVSQWFTQHFSNAEPPPDLTNFGITTRGLQLVPTPQGPAVAVVYETAQHQTLMFFIRPPGRSNYLLKPGSRRDGNLVAKYWSDNSYNYAVVSAIELAKIPALKKFSGEGI